MMLQFVRRAAPLVLLLASTPLAGQRSARRVIDRTGIAAAGWHRLGDVASALPPGATASFDGYNHELSGSRLGFLATTGARLNWIVRVNHQEIPVRLGGLWILDALPVAMVQVDSIVIVETPQVDAGRAVFLGTIDIFTRRVPRGASVVADYQHGDETGDPGPYRYTPRATPNIEKLGPFASGAVAFGHGRVGMDGAARYVALNTTDPRILSQLSQPGFQQDVNTSGGSGVVTIDAFGGQHFLIGGRGRFTGVMDSPRSPGIQQGRVITTQIGASGGFAFANRPWRYAATITQLDLGPLGGMFTPLDTQRRVMREGFVEGAVSRRLRIGAGGTFGTQLVRTDTTHRIAARAWAEYDATVGLVTSAIEHAGDRVWASGSLRHQRALADSSRFTITVTALSAWRGAEYEWMETDPDIVGGSNVFDLRADLETRALLGAYPTWYARAFRYTGATNGHVDGVAIGFVMDGSHGNRFRWRVRGEATQLVANAESGEASTPAGFIDASGSMRAAGGFFLAAAARYAPATRWPPSTSVDPLGEVPATRRIDFSVNKSLWSDRVRGQLVMRNLLNAPERTHPGGAQWNLRAHLAVTIALPSGAGVQ